jgi:hypothetical protein
VGDYHFLSDMTATQLEILKYIEMILGNNYGYIVKDICRMVPEEKIALNGKSISIDELADIAQEFVLKKKRVKKVKFK